MVGDSIYNLIKLNDFQVDDDERPLFPPVIERAEVISNPFADLRPRIDPPWQRKEALQTTKQHAKVKPKNTQLLSFGEEGEEELLGAENGGNALTMSMTTKTMVPQQLLDEPVVRKRAKLEEEEKAEQHKADGSGGGGGGGLSNGNSISDDEDDHGSDKDKKKAKKKKSKKNKKEKKKKDKSQKKIKGLELKDVKSVNEDAYLFKKTQRVSTGTSKDIEAKFDAFRKQLKKN